MVPDKQFRHAQACAAFVWHPLCTLLWCACVCICVFCPDSAQEGNADAGRYQLETALEVLQRQSQTSPLPGDGVAAGHHYKLARCVYMCGCHCCVVPAHTHALCSTSIACRLLIFLGRLS